jgi:hypothetical protein
VLLKKGTYNVPREQSITAQSAYKVSRTILTPTKPPISNRSPSSAGKVAGTWSWPAPWKRMSGALLLLPSMCHNGVHWGVTSLTCEYISLFEQSHYDALPRRTSVLKHMSHARFAKRKFWRGELLLWNRLKVKEKVRLPLSKPWGRMKGEEL